MLHTEFFPIPLKIIDGLASFSREFQKGANFLLVASEI
ncbi:hypothetical protein RAHE111665_17815 [Rariglobus hedericola]